MKIGKVNLYRVRATEPVQLLPYYLPDNKLNNVEISSEIEPRGSRYPIVSFRNGLFMGMKPTWMVFQQPTKIHYLKDGDGVYMSSIPQEMEQLNRQLRRAKGKVLIGGLGLGIAVALLEANPDVQSITACEINRDVVDLISPYVPHQKTEFVQGDLRKHLKNWRKLKTRFDFAYYDIWRGTGEWDHWNYVIPLRQLSDGVVPQDKLQCWNEDEMIGQITIGCHSLITLTLQQNGRELIETISKEGCAGMLARSAFIHYLAKEKPSLVEAEKSLGSFIRALKHPRLFKQKWEKYNQQTTT